jgi:hypothetical protein
MGSVAAEASLLAGAADTQFVRTPIHATFPGAYITFIHVTVRKRDTLS